MKLAVINVTGGGISGGYRNYLANVLPRLAMDDRVESLLCVSPSALHVQDWIPNKEKIRFAGCSNFYSLSLGMGRDLTRILSSFCPDVIHVPTARIVRFRDVPVVTMIQNMAPLHSWQGYGLSEKTRLAVLRIESSRAVKQADSVIAISDYVRDFLVNAWVVPGDKVVSIYFGAGVPSANCVRPLKLPPEWTEFVFTAGVIEPYRGLEDVIKCAEHSRKKLNRPLRIAIAGSSRKCMRSYENGLKALAEKTGVSTDICWLGQIPGDEMSWCYKYSCAFVMTSRIEACPSTVLEAMSCGAVSVAADNPPLPELYGEAALYYKPGDGLTLSAKIHEIISWDIDQRTRFSAAAKERSRKFSWENTAKKTVDLFERVSKGE